MKNLVLLCFVMFIFLNANYILAQKSGKTIDTIIIPKGNQNAFFQKHFDALSKDSLNLKITIPEQNRIVFEDQVKDPMPIFEPKSNHNMPVIQPKGLYVMPIYGSGSTNKDGLMVINPLENKTPLAKENQ